MHSTQLFGQKCLRQTYFFNGLIAPEFCCIETLLRHHNLPDPLCSCSHQFRKMTIPLPPPMFTPWWNHSVSDTISLTQYLTYIPGFWQVVKYGWIQYIAVLFIFIFIMERVKFFMYSNQIVSTVVERPFPVASKKHYH